jgi:hypothetical protein
MSIRNPVGWFELSISFTLAMWLVTGNCGSAGSLGASLVICRKRLIVDWLTL